MRTFLPAKALAAFLFSFIFFNTQAAVIGPDSVCAGEKVTYYVPYVSGALYSWNVSGGNTLSGTNTDSLVVQWNNAGVGTIVVTQLNPAATHTLNVVINPKPTPQITHAPYPTCPTPTGGGGSVGQGDHKPPCEKVCKYSIITYSTILNAGSTYNWVVTGAQNVVGANTNSVTVTWDSTQLAFLTVYETNAFGCTDSATVCIEKVDLPVASFTHQTNACKFSTVAFTNTSTGAVSYQWYFGDGGSSVLTNPIHAYSTAGSFTITLIATNQCNCKDTFQSIIIIDSLPGPSITCPSTVCAFDTATYSTTGTAGCTYNWFAIGGTIIAGQGTPSVTVAWGAGQLGTLGLYISGCNTVCGDTTFITIPIVPSVAVISGASKVCPGECHTYSLPYFSGATYTWSLTNNCGGTLSDTVCCNEVEVCYPPFFNFCNDTLTVSYYDSFLGCGGTAQFVIRLRPELAVLGPNPACANSTTTYSALGGVPCVWSVSPIGPILIPPVGPNVSVNWNNLTGTFVLKAVPVNPNAVCNDSAFIIVNVVAPPAVPVITGDTVVCQNSAASYCATGNNINWIITGGTPANANGNCITVNWGNTPPFIVRAFDLMPNSPYCSSDTAVQILTPILSLPAPNILASTPFCANSTNSFSTNTNYPPSTTYSWSINPPNAGSALSPNSSSTQVQWGNNAPQNVTVTLTVSACGQTAGNSVTVTLNPIPNPTATQLGNLCAGGTAQLQASGGVSYNWSGPSGYSSASNPTSITLNGLYQVTATATNGCTALSQINVQYVSGPTASISTLDYLSYCIGFPYSVNMCALGNANYTYNWSNAQTTQCITINTPGAYSVVVTDITNNCTALSNFLVVTEDSCIPIVIPGTCSFAGNISFTHTSCNPVSFSNTSVNASLNTVVWNFGDNTTSTLYNPPAHSYPQAGFYVVTLTGYVYNGTQTDSCLLRDTAHIEIPLLGKFDANIGCANQPVCFTDMSTFTAGNNITSWLWNFGDANTSTLQNPCHTYASSGTYVVTLTVSNGICTDVVTKTIIVPALPTAAFTVSAPNCVGLPVQFTDASFSNIVGWNWSFSNGATSLNQNPQVSFSPAGSYSGTLTVTDSFGCTNSTLQTFIINNPSISGNITALPDTIVCSGTFVTLYAPTCGTCTYLWSNGSTADTIVVATTGVYSVTLTDNSGCPYSTFITIVVNNGPPVTITNSGSDELCLGDFTQLSVPNNTNYLYQWISNDANANGSTFYQVLVSPAVVGNYTYQVIVTDTTTGCSDTSLVYNILVHPIPAKPNVAALTPTTVCKGDTIILVASHPDPTVTLQWSNGGVGDTLLVIKGGCYTLVATDTNGCANDTTICVTVNPLPDLCSFYEGCLDTCSPYTINGPVGASTYLWLLNGLSTGATTQNYTATVSGAYSVIVSNSYGCFDTTGVLNLTLYPCDTSCADLWIDSVKCNPNGTYQLFYHVKNNTQIPVTEISIQILPPHLNVAYAPNLNIINLPANATSPQLSATIFNASAGDTLCFRSHIMAYDSLGEPILCCPSDTDCIILPPCGDSCCKFTYVKDSVWCKPSPTGNNYEFVVRINGCGSLTVTGGGLGGILTGINGNYTLNNNTITLNGTYTPSGPADSVLCFTYVMSNGQQVYCADTTICFKLKCDESPIPVCLLNFNDTICVGQNTTYTYGGNPTGLTFFWQFPNGSPATANGPGPHNVTYNTVGCHTVICIINNNLPGTVDCIDTVCVLPPPVATIQQSGNLLLASPAGYAYQWYTGFPGGNPINGATNQFYQPNVGGFYCVVVGTGSCSDTACIDFIEVGLDNVLNDSWQLSPNPNQGAFNLQVVGSYNGNAELKVINAMGQIIDQRMFNLHNGINHFYVENSSLVKGVYYVQLIDKHKISVTRMVVN